MLQKHLTLLLLCLATLAQAQTTLRLGAGLTEGHMSHTYTELFGFSEDRFSDELFGFGVDFGAQYLDRGLYSLYSDISFIQSGGKDTPSDKENTRYTFLPNQFRVNYLSLGTMVLVSPIRKKFRLQMGLGPRVDFLVSYKESLLLNWPEKNHYSLSRVNYGISGMLGLYKTIGKTEVGLGVTYFRRFLKLMDIPPVFTGAESIEHTVMFRLSVGHILL
jgi:hypothetical protein